ncbi:bifunctional nuclease family protein [bacterium]|nr:bifunctional nuclease family protein [bacterium]
MVEMKIVNLTDQNNQRMVWLQSVEDDTMLPILIGDAEAIAISVELADKQMVRPLTHDLLKTILDRFDATVKRINIVDLKDEIFYAELILKCNEREIRIDARPSDSIALALKYGAPVFIEEEVLNIAGGRVKTGKTGISYFEKMDDDGLDLGLDIDIFPVDEADLEEAVRDLIDTSTIEEEEIEEERPGEAVARVTFLKQQMDQAIKEERYEDAGQLRDQIDRMEEESE